MPRTKNKPARIFLAVAVLTLALVLPLRAQAGWLGDVVGFTLDSVSDLILGLLSLIVDFVGLVVIGISASLVNYVFTFQNFVKVPVVQIGWTLSRDLANMVFILIMLAMAFGTILRYESYGWKRLLPRLVLVALLINFSLIIGGAVIDVGNSLGRFFVSGGGENAAVGDFIMASVRAGQLSQLRNERPESVLDRSPVTALIMTTVVQLVFYLILAFLLLAMGLIMIFRIVNLWILLVLAPLAWISYAIPGKSGYWNDWWKKFTTWALFPAYMGFFIFLGLLVGSTFSGSPFASSAPDAGGFWSILFPDTLFSVIMQFIVVVAILFFGLAQAQSLSGAGAKTMMAGVGKMQAWGAGKLKGVGAATVRPLGRGATSLAQRALYKEGEGGQRTELRGGVVGGLQRISGLPIVGKPLGKIAAGAAGAVSQLADQRKKMIEEEEKKLKDNSSQTIRLIFESLNKEAKAAALKILAERNDLEIMSKNDALAKRLGKSVKDLTEAEKNLELTAEEKEQVGKLNPAKNGGITQSRFEEALKYAGLAGLDKEILNAAPQFAYVVGKKLQEVIDKIPPSKADKIQSGSLELESVRTAIREAVKSKSWDSGQLNKISDDKPKASAELLEYLRGSLTDVELDQLTKKTKNYILTGGAAFETGGESTQPRIIPGTETAFQEAKKQPGRIIT